MVQFVFALLDVRRVIHLAVLAGRVAGIDAFGPTDLQVLVNRFIVTPIVQSTTVLHDQLDHGAAVVHDIGRRLGWR